MNVRRPYQMGARAAAAAETGRRILEATQELFLEAPLHEVTLQAVAVRAGVTQQTVIRRFGSRPGLIAAAVADATARVRAHREQAPVGDLTGAVKNLFDHYEAWADVSLKVLVEAQRSEEGASLSSDGRALHAAWVDRVFAPQLEARRGRDRTELRHQLIAVCDVYVWKLLRRDQGLPRAAAERAVLGIVRALCRDGGG
jgi:AcrR family transcriptional regulator